MHPKTLNYLLRTFVRYLLLAAVAYLAVQWAEMRLFGVSFEWLQTVSVVPVVALAVAALAVSRQHLDVRQHPLYRQLGHTSDTYSLRLPATEGNIRPAAKQMAANLRGRLRHLGDNRYRITFGRYPLALIAYLLPESDGSVTLQVGPRFWLHGFTGKLALDALEALAKINTAVAKRDTLARY